MSEYSMDQLAEVARTVYEMEVKGFTLEQIFSQVPETIKPTIQAMLADGYTFLQAVNQEDLPK